MKTFMSQQEVLNTVQPKAICNSQHEVQPQFAPVQEKIKTKWNVPCSHICVGFIEADK